jgi:L-rhamnose mutarotase
MQRICFTLQVKPDRLEEYRARHQQVWPELLSALSEAGWSNYSLFLRDDGLLIGYCETDNFDRALENMATTEVNARWQASVVDLFEGNENRAADERMRPIPQVFFLP